MADGRTKPAAKVRAGERVYGTVKEANRHYMDTEVLTCCTRLAEAFRIEVADGTTLVAGQDQCVLSCRGWKHVTGTEQGLSRRPHLTIGAKLIGTGSFSPRSESSRDYRRGYLTGLIRGDGHVRSYECVSRHNRPWTKHNFRLALADVEPLARAEQFLAEFGVPVTRFVFQRATATAREVHAIGNQRQAGVDGVREIIAWPLEPKEPWCAGFLAGIFDAEGSCSGRETLRICNGDPEILEWTTQCFQRFGFETVHEQPKRRNVAYIRLRGGLAEKLRFFHTTDPVIERKRCIRGTGFHSSSALRVESIESMGCRLRLAVLSTSTGDIVANGLVCRAQSGS